MALSNAQAAELQHAEPNHFIIAEYPEGDVYLLLTSAVEQGNGRPSVILAHLLSRPTRGSLMHWQRHGTWLSTSEDLADMPLPVENLINSGEAVLHYDLPMIDITERFFGVTCAYTLCDEGLVRVCEETYGDVPALSTAARQPDPGRVWTLCPYCMTFELFARHERLIRDHTWDNNCMPHNQSPGDFISRHIQRINDKRVEIGYDLLPNTINLVFLNLECARSLEMYNDLRGRFLPLTAPGSSPVSDLPIFQQSMTTHSYDWFVRASERVVGNGCNICLDRFEEREAIAGLPCKHFFHDHCVLQWFRQGKRRCPNRCPGEVWVPVTSVQRVRIDN